MKKLKSKKILFVSYAIVFSLGFILSYSAQAAISKPTRADWAAYNSLTKVKIKRVDPLSFKGIERDLNTLERRSQRYARRLPMQLSGAVKKVRRNRYRRASRIR